MLRGSVLTSSFFHLFFGRPNLHSLFVFVPEVTKISSKISASTILFNSTNILKHSVDTSFSRKYYTSISRTTRFENRLRRKVYLIIWHFKREINLITNFPAKAKKLTDELTKEMSERARKIKINRSPQRDNYQSESTSHRTSHSAFWVQSYHTLFVDNSIAIRGNVSLERFSDIWSNKRIKRV